MPIHPKKLYHDNQQYKGNFNARKTLLSWYKKLKKKKTPHQEYNWNKKTLKEDRKWQNIP